MRSRCGWLDYENRLDDSRLTPGAWDVSTEIAPLLRQSGGSSVGLVLVDVDLTLLLGWSVEAGEHTYLALVTAVGTLGLVEGCGVG